MKFENHKNFAYLTLYPIRRLRVKINNRKFLNFSILISKFFRNFRNSDPSSYSELYNGLNERPTRYILNHLGHVSLAPKDNVTCHLNFNLKKNRLPKGKLDRRNCNKISVYKRGEEFKARLTALCRTSSAKSQFKNIT